ncbi:hypothetical protein GL307_31270, partial [Nocardia seriolae]
MVAALRGLAAPASAGDSGVGETGCPRPDPDAGVGPEKRVCDGVGVGARRVVAGIGASSAAALGAAPDEALGIASDGAFGIALDGAFGIALDGAFGIALDG